MRKLLACLVVLGACLLLAPGPGTAGALPCTYLCCPAEDWDAECSIGFPYTTTCYSWWHFEGGTCP